MSGIHIPGSEFTKFQTCTQTGGCKHVCSRFLPTDNAMLMVSLAKKKAHSYSFLMQP